MSLDTATTVFTVLTFVANIAFVSLVVVGGAALTGPGRRGLAGRVVSAIGGRARPAALVVAAVTTAGSLYYSEVKGLIPCELCWYQRTVMYPLVVLLTVGVLRRDKAVFWYAAPLVAIGAPFALYHWLVERVSWLSSSTSCSAFVSCNIPYFEKLGYITLAFMDLSSFLLIAALLTVGRTHDRATMKTP